MARIAYLLMIGLAAPAGAATQLTADQALENYRTRFEPVDCPTPTDPDEIVVCGRPNETNPNRLPFPVPREPGVPIRGEPVGGAAFTCIKSCPQPLKLDLIKAARIGRKIIRHILDPD